jgi:hypothetical protein
MNLATLDYSYVLAALAKLPLPISYRLSRLRGALNAHFDRDWRSISLGVPYVKTRTKEALIEILEQIESGRDLCSHAPDANIEQLIRRRFIYAALEEWQAALIQAGRLSHLRISGADVHSNLPRQAIFATIHFDSPMIGLVQLGRWGRCLSALSSNVYESPSVPSAIKDFFNNKYNSMATHWHGGRCYHKETHIADFINAAKRGGSLAVFCDAPAVIVEKNSPESNPNFTDTRKMKETLARPRGQLGSKPILGTKGVWVPFLGKYRLVAPILLRLSTILNLPVIGVVCKSVSHNEYEINFSKVYRSDNLFELMTGIYGFFSEHIIDNPGAWWASDILGSFLVSNDNG